MAHKKLFGLAIAAAVLAASASHALAVGGGEVLVDEFGNGYFQDALGNAAISIPSVTLATDPIGGKTNVLAYNLSSIAGGPSPLDGDLFLSEPAGGTSDLLRFETIGGTHYLLFYSDVSANDPADAPADIGLPTVFSSNILSVSETGLALQLNLPPGHNFVVNDATYSEDGVNGYRHLHVNMTNTQPGYDTNVISNYYFVSDGAVPEPASLGLLGLGAAVMLVRRKRA